MSEWVSHVYCTCFQQGLTTEPPYAWSDLTVNRFGVVTLIDSVDHAEDPEDLWCWRVGMNPTDIYADAVPPCAHDDMKLVTSILYWPGSRSYNSHYPIVEGLIARGGYPALGDIMYRQQDDNYPSGGIWIQAREAPAALEEASRLVSFVPTNSPGRDDSFVRTLRELLDASVTTGNPVINHYNGIIDRAW